MNLYLHAAAMVTQREPHRTSRSLTPSPVLTKTENVCLRYWNDFIRLGVPPNVHSYYNLLLSFERVRRHEFSSNLR